ncbi:MAG: hypothetical protein LC808_06080 [Actinobacteria bacterium]|nr:hypothetical protein [Actinomycetota bacterium]
MERHEAERILASLRVELDTTEATVRSATQRAGALRKLIEGYVELFPDLATDSTVSPASVEAESSVGQPTLVQRDPRPRGQEAIRQVMQKAVGKWWTVSSLVRELEQRGWLPDSEIPASAVRTAVERLVSTDPNVHKDKGRTGAVTYSFRPFAPPHEVESNGHSPVHEEVDSS